MTEIEHLYERYAGDVRRFALYLCGDIAMADEITSDTFVRAWMAAGRIRQPTVKSYLFTIAGNAYTDLLRRAGRHTQLNENMRDRRISAQTQMEESAEVRAVLAALQQLPETDRTVLLMRALDEMPYEEIAETVGTSVVAAKVKVHRARLKLMQARQAWREVVPAARRKTMNVTREVVMDLLPIYFSDEASADTKMLVEDYFRQDPDFERIARSAAKPLETLRAAAPIKASSEKEKRDLESILWGLRRRTWLFGVSLFLTLVPLAFDFTHGHIVSLTVRGNHWHAAFD